MSAAEQSAETDALRHLSLRGGNHSEAMHSDGECFICDGLTQPWWGRQPEERVWCNPPYSRVRSVVCDYHQQRPDDDSIDCECAPSRDLGSWVQKAWNEWNDVVTFSAANHMLNEIQRIAAEVREELGWRVVNPRHQLAVNALITGVFIVGFLVASALFPGGVVR